MKLSRTHISLKLFINPPPILVEHKCSNSNSPNDHGLHILRWSFILNKMVFFHICFWSKIVGAFMLLHVLEHKCSNKNFLTSWQRFFFYLFTDSINCTPVISGGFKTWFVPLLWFLKDLGANMQPKTLFIVWSINAPYGFHGIAEKNQLLNGGGVNYIN